MMAQDTDFIEQAYDYHLETRYGEVGYDGVTTLSSLANWLQEAAGHSADSLGFGEKAMSAHGVTWILTRLVLRIQRLPLPGERLKVHTWPSVLDRFGHRGYEVFDENGQLLIRGGSAWGVMDLHTRRMTALPSDLTAHYPAHPRPCDPFTCRTLPRLNGNEGATSAIRVRRDDLDINAHVNNARYLSWLLEALPLRPAGSDPLVPRLVDITFRMECFPGDELISLARLVEPDDTADPAPFRLVHALRAIRGQEGECREEEVCRAISLWAENPLYCAS